MKQPSPRTAAAPRIYVDRPLTGGDTLELPAAQSRHLQVLRLQPGDPLIAFDGRGGEWGARIVKMGRSTVDVLVGNHQPVERELQRHVTLAFGMPANERMDALVEKATELGVGTLQPLVCERSVLRLEGERAHKRLGHWQGVAVAAAEQSGRTRLPVIGAVQPLRAWLDAQRTAPGETGRRVVLRPGAATSWQLVAGDRHAPLVVLSGPEGGLSPGEDEAADAAGFLPASLGPRVLRADTAPLAVLAWCGLGLAAAGA